LEQPWKKQSDYSSKVYSDVKSCKNEHLRKAEKTTKLLGTKHEFSELKHRAFLANIPELCAHHHSE